MIPIDRDTQILSHIYNYCDKIQHTVVRFGTSFDTFSTDADYQDSIAMNLLQIGEFVSKLSDDFVKKTSDAISWRNIKGMRTITLDYTYQEICNSVDNKEIYMYRSKSVTAKSSRANDDTPYTFNVSNVQHRDSNDNVIRTFDMVSSEYIIPAGLWGWSIKESGEFCSYSNTHANKGDIIISINGSIYPYAKRIVLELAY